LHHIRCYMRKENWHTQNYNRIQFFAPPTLPQPIWAKYMTAHLKKQNKSHNSLWSSVITVFIPAIEFFSHEFATLGDYLVRLLGSVSAATFTIALNLEEWFLFTQKVTYCSPLLKGFRSQNFKFLNTISVKTLIRTWNQGLWLWQCYVAPDTDTECAMPSVPCKLGKSQSGLLKWKNLMRFDYD
jgi:hypothetical protein